MSKLRSPNDMMEAARNMMLNGREIETPVDAQLVVNFLAVNVHPDIAETAIMLMVRLYDLPVSDEEVISIIRHHQKADRNG